MISPASERNHFMSVLEKYNQGTATKREIEFVELYYDYIQKHGKTDLHFSALDKEATWMEVQATILETISDEPINEQNKSIVITPTRRVKTILLKWKWPAVAAALLGIVVTLLFHFQTKDNTPLTASSTSNYKTELPLNVDKALLTLHNGSTITLDSASIGTIAQQGNTRITKLNNGQLVYEESLSAHSQQAIQHNIISTPRGGQFHIVLPDGSKAWMNAASSIRFPVAFSRDRKVTVSGEVYFEIAHLKDQPFIVATGETEVQVLGTAFNIKAYRDEAFIETTLLEGRVKILNASNNLLLTPGQQAVYNNDNKIILVNDVALDRVIAWKNGLFWFENAPIQTFMQHVERWYAIDVKYHSEIPKLKFTGKMERSLNLAQLLKVLKTLGVKCSVDKNVLTVYP